MDIEFPKKGKQLFTSTNDYYTFSHFGWGDINSQFYGYIKGYKESADTLVEFALSSKRIAILDTYIFPILFLYRQFIELSLKSLYLEYSKEPMADKIQTIKQASHNLENMWKKVKPILIEASDSKDEKDTVKTVESYILQYHRFDKGSFKFRYPIDKDYNPLLQGEERIDIVNLKECMTELDNFFGGAEMRAEYEAEIRSYMDWI